MKKAAFFLTMMGFVLLIGFAPKSHSCRRPLPWNNQHCHEVEQVILNATVRIVLHGWVEVETGYDVARINGGISHATVVDGRYLITHNHFGIPLSQVMLYNQYANGEFTGVSVYRLDGTIILDHAPLDSFAIIAETGETVVIDFGVAAGEGFFTQAGVGSARAANLSTIQLVPGTEVAQIDWDRHGLTRVVWTKVKSVYQENGVPLVRVDHVIQLGASGGGVFLDGRLIGNNWGNLVETNLNTGVVRQRLSLVALNS
ncbi:MAG: hypothetical protein H6667_19490 [Ardenticatenaceae bacterium]|nr:hypothetical protein [Ardenticatenaceae bacterium]